MEIQGTSTDLANEGKIQFYKDANIGASLTVSEALANVTQTIQNNQLNGYSNLYLKNTSGNPALAENM